MPKRHAGGSDGRAGAIVTHAIELLILMTLLWIGALSDFARAGELEKDDVSDYLSDPLYVGERDSAVPVWPLFQQSGGAPEDLVGYAFESIDLAPIAGYSGTPPNVLVAVTPEGKFIDVTMISHNEPIFKHGVAEEALTQFADQYTKQKLALTQHIKVMPTNASSQGTALGHGTEWIDGVARATVSVRIINQAVLSAALKIARAKLGIAAGRDPEKASKLKPDSGETLTLKEIIANSYLVQSEIQQAAVEESIGPAFNHDVAPSPGTDQNANSTQVWSLYVGAPQIGRAVLGKEAFERLSEDLDEGDHAILLGSSGRYGFQGADQARNSVPENLALTQDGLPIVINESTDVELIQSSDLPKVSNWVVVKVHKQTGFDPTHPFKIMMRITRQNTELFPRRETKEFPVAFKAPVEYFSAPVVSLEGWQAIWYEQRAQIGLAAVAVVLLSLALAMQSKLTSNSHNFNAFRTVFLVATLVGIGWWGQGQLSINNVLGVINAAKANGDFGFLLFDPVSLLLWVFVLATLVLYGRGTFCGWLCPFGAFQEFVGNIAQRFKVPQIKIPYAIDQKLRLLKYVLLGAIVFSALTYMPAAEWLAELEPFKTAITLGFDRSWPFVVYAVAVLLFSAFVYKGFCLYLCPLGATLALLGSARRLNWIPRRKECGSPCQLCAVRCRYGAIEPRGEVRYDECFQCMECVVIHNDANTCVPLVLSNRNRTTVVREEPAVQPVKEVAI